VTLVVTVLTAGCAQPARDGDARAREADFERVGLDAFRSDGASATLVDGVTYDGGAVVVGSVAGDTETGPDDVAPLVIESADGITWRRAELGPPTGAASMVAVAAGADGIVLAAGAVTRPTGGTELALWRRDQSGRWGEPTKPDDLPPGLSVVPRGFAGGPAGFMIAGSRGSRFEIWISPDGDRWHRSASGRMRMPPLVVVGEEFVTLLGSPDPEVGTVDVLVSSEGGELAKVDQIGGATLARVDDAVFVQGRYLAVGGERQSPEGDYSPATWLSDGPSSWSDGPRLEDASSDGSTSGSWAATVASDPDGRVLVTSATSSIWTSGEEEGVLAAFDDPLPDARAFDQWIAVRPAGVPTAFTSDRLVGAGDEGWDDRAAELVPIPRLAFEVTGVAHGPGGFVAVGAQRRVDAEEPGGYATQGLVWRSPDGRAWERLPTDPVLARTLLLDVTAYEGGFVAVGLAMDDAASAAGRVFVSGDGSEWEAVEGDGLRPPEGGIHQLESVVAYREGFIATGFGAEGTTIAPLILVSSDGSSVERADVPAPPTGDRITLGACATRETAVVVGVERVDSSTAAAWRSRDGVNWDSLPTDSPELSGLVVCSMSEDGALVAGGNLGVAGDTAAAGVATDLSLELRPLPGSGLGAILSGISWVDDVPVVVGQPAPNDPRSGALVWLATSDAAFEWTHLTSNALHAVGVRDATGVAAGEGVVVVTGNTLTGGAAWTARADDLVDP
jgi:hypothetical protein